VNFSRRERLAVHWTVLALPVIAWIVAIGLIGLIAQQFFAIITMFFLAWLLAFLLDPVVNVVVNRVPILPRGLTAALVFVVVLVIAMVLLVAIASSVLNSLISVISRAGTFTDAIVQALAPLQQQLNELNISIDLEAAVEGFVEQLRTSSAGLLSQVLQSGVLLFTQGTAIIFIAVVMVANKSRFLAFLRRLVPENRMPLFEDFLAATSKSFGGFIRGQFGLAGLYGVIVAVIAITFGVPFVALTALVTAALQSIPYFGQLVSWIPLVLMTLVFKPDVLLPVTVLLVISLLVVQNIVSPRVMGTAVGLNPILVLAAVFVGAQVAGVLGAVFGVPVLAVASTLFSAWLDRVRPEPDSQVEAASPDYGGEAPAQVGSNRPGSGESAAPV
jgi:predicted PurR-regulated permease PerM